MAFLPTFHHRVPAVFVYENFGGFHCHFCGDADMFWPPCKTVLPLGKRLAQADTRKRHNLPARPPAGQAGKKTEETVNGTVSSRDTTARGAERRRLRRGRWRVAMPGCVCRPCRRVQFSCRHHRIQQIGDYPLKIRAHGFSPHFPSPRAGGIRVMSAEKQNGTPLSVFRRKSKEVMLLSLTLAYPLVCA